MLQRLNNRESDDMSKILIFTVSLLVVFALMPIFAIDVPSPAPQQKDPYAGLSPLELSKKGEEAYNAGRMEEAEKIYVALLKTIPDDPIANKRLQELKEHKQNAEAEAIRKAELAEKLKNADYFLLKGDEAYKAGDYSTAASYYIKVAEIEDTFQYSGVKYWISKAMEADINKDSKLFKEAFEKIAKHEIPELLQNDMETLRSLSEKYKPPENSVLSVSLESRTIIDRFQLFVDGNMVWDSSLSTWVGKKSSVDKAFYITPGDHIIKLQVKMLSAAQPFEVMVNYSTLGGQKDSLLFNFPFLGGIKIELNGKPVPL